jgi:signal transduction histidine kinase
MTQDRDPSPVCTPGPLEHQGSAGRQLLAFSALSQLNRQIADNPDFYTLINLLLLTVSGQFSVANSFAAIRSPRRPTEQPLLFTTGTYEKSPELASKRMFNFYMARFAGTSAPMCVEGEDDFDRDPECLATLQAHDVTWVIPLVSDDDAFGAIGLGSRVIGKPFSNADIELLVLMVHAIAPFMANLSTEYFDLFNSVRQGVMIFDAHNRLMRINATALRILEQFRGLDDDSGSVYGLPLAEIFSDDAFSGWGPQILHAKDQPRGTLVSGLIARHGDLERYYNVRVSAINRRSATRSDLLVIFDDVTEEKANEQRMYELQKFAETGIMATSIAHELNNYLALILGGIEIAERSVTANNPEKMKRSIEKVKGHIGMMGRFTAGLTHFGRMESRISVCQLNTVVQHVVSFIKAQKRFKYCTLEVDLDANLPAFEMDPDQVSQLMLNLLNNAADAIAQAGHEEGWIRIKTVRKEDRACLSIADNGIGIRPEVKAKLFREHLTTKENGHGFGLVTCSKILKDHEAEFDIQGEPGAGTTFTFLFPLERTMNRSGVRPAQGGV